jgi:hypothetical protein
MALFPVRYYLYLTAPLNGHPPAAVVVVEPELADWMSA